MLTTDIHHVIQLLQFLSLLMRIFRIYSLATFRSIPTQQCQLQSYCTLHPQYLIYLITGSLYLFEVLNKYHLEGSSPTITVSKFHFLICSYYQRLLKKCLILLGKKNILKTSNKTECFLTVLNCMCGEEERLVLKVYKSSCLSFFF